MTDFYSMRGETMITKITIVDDVHTGTTREPDDDGWDRGNSVEYHNITGFYVSEENMSFDLSIPFTPKKDTPYYLVYIDYNTGDSFGHDEGLVRFVELFQSEEKAEELERKIDKDYRENKEKFTTIEYLLDDGKEARFYTGDYKGYFDSLNSVNIKKIYLI